MVQIICVQILWLYFFFLYRNKTLSFSSMWSVETTWREKTRNWKVKCPRYGVYSNRKGDSILEGKSIAYCLFGVFVKIQDTASTVCVHILENFQLMQWSIFSFICFVWNLDG